MTRVLIVDDNEQNLYLLRRLFEPEGFEIDEARHGGEALLKARLNLPALVISDLLMPVMDGYTLLWQWKGDARLGAIPFVVYTATYVEAMDERLALAMGADAFLIKPAEPEVLLARVREVLELARHGAASAGATSVHMDQGLLAQYNAVLVRKLEKRALQLEHSHAELQESEDRFRATFEQAAVGIAHVGLDGRFLRINDKLCEILGYPREELLQLDFASLTLPEDQPDSDRARQAMLAGTLSHYDADKRYRRKDGNTVWVSLVSSLLRSAVHEPRYFISVLTDISERKALESKIYQAQKLESVGQLTAGIAHDFNNLLTVVIGNADLLAEELAGDTHLAPLAEMTRSAARRGAELTKRLLAFARRQALAPRAVDVNALLQGLERMLKLTLPESVEMRLVQGDALWPALVDAAQLESAVLNLAINARDAMPAGGRLTIEAGNVTVEHDPSAPQADLSPGAYVVVAVTDTGTGIAPEHLARVFDPFFTTKPVGQGSGLGLSMVYGFAKQSRGHVRIYSEPGHGATFRLYLPRAIGQDLESGPETLPGALQAHGGETILLVEDDELVRRFAEAQLASLGYRVVSAENGLDAMAIVRTSADIDLLLTDVVMPGGMSGPQLADASLALRPSMKVLFSSGYADQALVQGGRLDPGVNLLSKPYGRKELARKVSEVLGGETATAPPPGRPAGTGRLLVLDDDPLVAKVLGMAAQRLSFEVRLTSDAPTFLARAADWSPTHVSLDLSMPDLDGIQVLDRLAEAGCASRVIIASGADASQVDAAIHHARERGLSVAGALAKPFTRDALRALLGG